MDRLKTIWNNNGGFLVVALVLTIFFLWQMAKKMKLDAAVKGINERSPDLMTLSYLGRTDLPRGARNNNPGNLTKTSIPWQGKIGNDGRFEKFKSYVWGVRALIRQLRTNINSKGLNTLRKLITSYAPPSENNTEGYIASMVARTGYLADQVLVPTFEVLKNLAQNITWKENGNPMPEINRDQWISNDMFKAAWELEQA